MPIPTEEIVRHDAVSMCVSLSEKRALKVTTFDNSPRFCVNLMLDHEPAATLNLRNSDEVEKLIQVLRESQKAWEEEL